MYGSKYLTTTAVYLLFVVYTIITHGVIIIFYCPTFAKTKTKQKKNFDSLKSGGEHDV